MLLLDSLTHIISGFKKCSDACLRVSDGVGGWAWDDDESRVITDMRTVGPTSTPYTLYNDY